jgi:membrane protein DedA with SNARE-associated domain
MAEIIDQLAQFIQEIIRSIGYVGIAFFMFAENVFPPIPSEIIMPFAGFLTVSPDAGLTFVGVWIAGIVGTVLGALVLYYVGWWAGDTVLRGLLRRYGRWVNITEKDYDRALSFFNRYGQAVVFFGRLIPVVRSLISLPAGADHMPMGKFLIFTTLGSAIWSGALAYAGVVLGANWEQVLDIIEQYQDIVVVLLVIVGVLFLGWVGYRFINRNKQITDTATE